LLRLNKRDNSLHHYECTQTSNFSGNLSDIMSAWLSAVPLPPSAPVVSDICATSCRVLYERPEIQVDGPPVTGYFLEAHTVNGPWIRVNNIPITGNEVRVTKLHPGISYEFRVTALNDNGCGEYSTASAAVVTFTENRPSQPGRPVATVIGTSVSLEWSMLDGGDNETEHFRYVIRGREANTERTILYTSTEQKAGATLHHTLNNKMLKPETQYEFAIAACSEAGLGRFSSYSNCVKTLSGWF